MLAFKAICPRVARKMTDHRNYGHDIGGPDFDGPKVQNAEVDIDGHDITAKYSMDG